MDMAFALNTPTAPVIQGKWIQLPNQTSEGIDILSTSRELENSLPLADDFLCTASGPITDITLWGSWLEDEENPNIGFDIAIWPDLPADDENNHYGFSVPDMSGEPLWERHFGGEMGPGYAQKRVYATGNETFWDPSNNFPTGTDTQIWQYDFSIAPEDAFVQQEGTTYWLAVYTWDISGGYSGPFSFGWKTAARHWNDDAVWLEYGDVDILHELQYPAGHPLAGQSIDLAFAIGGPTPNIVDPKTVELVNDADHSGAVSPGDTLKYTCVINNTGAGDALDVIFSDPIDPNTTLVVPSVTTSQGSVLSGNTSGSTLVVVDLGTISANSSATITFRVRIKNPCPVDQVANQALIEGSNFADTNSDDPLTEPPKDPTTVNISASPPPVKSIGGTVEPVNKANILMPWIGLGAALGLAFYLGVRVWRKAGGRQNLRL
jgi:uncharacterized repeat protein (TIGR01451 family)